MADLESDLRAAMHAAAGAVGGKLAPEPSFCTHWLAQPALTADGRQQALDDARALVRMARAHRHERSLLDAFLDEYGLSSSEGVSLMCLAESLLRVSDPDTADALIADRLAGRDWAEHRGHADAFWVNASTWALMLTGRLVQPATSGDWLQRLVGRLGEPVIRGALHTAMRIMGREFVLGETIEAALHRTRDDDARYSFDMLGEGARTEADAEHYFQRYAHAIERVGAAGRGDVDTRSGVSVKLSALHPQYDSRHWSHCAAPLHERLLALMEQAAEAGIGLSIDAEEAGRLEGSMALFERLAHAPQLAGWDGAGFVVQAYGKRAQPLIDWLQVLARRSGRRFPVRLVKGAYWDTEIKHAQEGGLRDFPVFTRKPVTDLSWLQCAHQLLGSDGWLWPQFATHNAHSLAAVMEMGAARGETASGAAFELQRLHGMGELLYDVAERHYGARMPAVRIYAPVGEHKDLVAYLIRRLLENGANASFVNRFLDEQAPVESVVADPWTSVATLAVPHPQVTAPAALFSPRRNSAGDDLDDPVVLERILAHYRHAAGQCWQAAPGVAGSQPDKAAEPVRSPARSAQVIGQVRWAQAEDLDAALSQAQAAQHEWDRRGGPARAAVLERAADLYERERHTLMYLAAAEAGKTLPDALAEVREAVDFLRFYARQAREHFAGPQYLPGPTGERNELCWQGCGVFACISPWNFPLAILTGLCSGALAAGNSVVAKPAEQTPLMAAHAVRLLHQAGVPPAVLHCLPGDGDLGALLVADPRVAGVAFTGSEATARSIHRSLAERPGPIVPLIAETGGVNAMFVDATALPEQVTDDVVRSAFGSAGQRCSALRVLYLQDAIYEPMLEMISGAMAALVLGDPQDPATDVGPVIDADARNQLEAHIKQLRRQGHRGWQVPLPGHCAGGIFVAPAWFEVDHIDQVGGEHFGPILHVRRFSDADFESCLQEVAAQGYGLTLGLHSRIESRAQQVFEAIPAGNVYINRNMIGAVVGAQPFGGAGRSGTGPKAGGPHYLQRFAQERALAVNTAAAGGNVELLARVR